MRALDIEDANERSAFVRKACGAEAALLAELEALLAAHDQAGAFLRGEAPAKTVSPAPATPHPETLTDSVLGTVSGRYKLLQRIGEGGFGVVYMAEQREPVKRRVALKIIKLGMDTKQVVGRFEAERQALAMMDHPNIAKVLDGGATDTGRPFFVMELVRGVSILQFCDENKLSTDERLRLFLDVCQAIHHAHQKGVIHRDIKPNNVLVTVTDDRGVPKVIDFGVAKATQHELTEKTVFTRYQEFIGTPAYMSPEQAQFSGLDIDTRTDVYSLGVLLYEMLTGRTPFDTKALLSGGYESMRRIIREQEPQKPSTRLHTLNRGDLAHAARLRKTEPGSLFGEVRGDLDRVVMKALDKERARRYESVSALAMDIRRYLDDEPVEAAGPSVWYQMGKFARRKRRMLVAAVMVACSLLVGIVVSSVMAARAIRAEGDLREALAKEFEARQVAQTAERSARDAHERAQRQARVAEAVNRFINEDLIGRANPVNEANRDLRLRTLLERADRKIEAGVIDEPLVEASIRYTVGQAFLNLGDLRAAKRHAQTAVRLLEGEEEDDTHARLKAQILLAGVEVDLGDYSRAGDSLETLRAVTRAQFGDAHELSMETAYWQALALGNLSQPEQAEALLAELLERMPATLPEDHWLRPAIVNARGAHFIYRKRYAEAERFYRDWLASFESRFGREHPFPIMLLSNLGQALYFQGKRSESETLYREALTLTEATFGPDHPHHLTVMAALGRQYEYYKQWAEAEALLPRVYEGRRRTLGESHPETRFAVTLLFAFYRGQERDEDAQRFLRDVIQRDPENFRALEHLAYYLKADELEPVVADSEADAVTWRYRFEAPEVDWLDPAYDDGAWLKGPGGFGNIDRPFVRTEWSTRTLWARQTFELDEVPEGPLVLRVAQDDNARIYLNGQLCLWRHGWTGRRYLLVYLSEAGQAALRKGTNVITVRGDNMALEGLFDVGLYRDLSDLKP